MSAMSAVRTSPIESDSDVGGVASAAAGGCALVGAACDHTAGGNALVGAVDRCTAGGCALVEAALPGKGRKYMICMVIAGPTGCSEGGNVRWVVQIALQLPSGMHHA